MLTNASYEFQEMPGASPAKAMSRTSAVQRSPRRANAVGAEVTTYPVEWEQEKASNPMWQAALLDGAVGRGFSPRPTALRLSLLN